MPKGTDAVPLLDSYTAQVFGAMQTVTIQPCDVLEPVDVVPLWPLRAELVETICCGVVPHRAHFPCKAHIRAL